MTSEVWQEKLAQSFYFTCRYINDVLSLSNFKFSDYLDFFFLSAPPLFSDTIFFGISCDIMNICRKIETI